MEKYRKFEDSSNGINPFLPEKQQKREIPFNIIFL